MDARRLAAIKLFADLDEDQLDRCAGACDEVAVAAGETLALEGEYGYKFFVVLDGEVDVVQAGTTVATLGPGDFFGEMALLDAGRRNADVVASRPSKLARMMLWDFRRLTEDVPALADAIDTIVAERMAAIRDE